jgi:hypothetical protein
MSTTAIIVGIAAACLFTLVGPGALILVGIALLMCGISNGKDK